MIIDFLLTIVFGILEFFVSLFPSPESLPDFMTPVNGFLEDLPERLGHLSGIFPVGTMITCALVVITVEVALNGFNLLNWLWNKTRGAG